MTLMHWTIIIVCTTSTSLCIALIIAFLKIRELSDQVYELHDRVLELENPL